MLDFGNILIIYGLKANTILLNICIDLIMLSMMFKEIERFFFFFSQQFITWGVMAVHAYRRNYVWSINTLTFFYVVTQHKGLLRN